MKLHLLLIALFLFTGNSVKGQPENKAEKNELKQYIFVMYTTGPNRTQDSTTAAKIQTGHLHHLDSLYKIGLLNIVGPILEEGGWKGILVFDVATKEEAEEHVKKDPAVIAGRLNYIIVPWMTLKGNCFK